MTLSSARKLAAALCALTLAGCAGMENSGAHDSMSAECPVGMHYAAFGMPGTPLAQLRAMASARLAVLGLEAAWQAPEGEAFDDGAEDRERLRGLLAVVLPAYERYPPALLARIQLRRLEFVKNLRVGAQLRRAMPAAQRDSVAYADIGGPLGACAAGIEARVHHELYHLIEARLFKDYYYRDPQWLALNPAGIRYGAGGSTAYGKAFSNLGHPQAGMVSVYALYGPEEDKAEVFGWMMTPGYASRLRRWAEQDPALAAKRQFMGALLAQLSAGTLGPADLDWLAARTQP